METFTELKAFVPNPQFTAQRLVSLQKLEDASIDEPLVGLIEEFAKLHCCFTLQCCYGHFVIGREPERYRLSGLHFFDADQEIEYRLAYLALCIEDSRPGRNLLNRLAKVRDFDPNMIQLGCCEWFWERQVNSFAIQVEPKRFRFKDRIPVQVEEARKIEATRDRFFEELEKLVLQ